MHNRNPNRRSQLNVFNNAKRWRWERFTSQISTATLDILLHKALSALSFGRNKKQPFDSAYGSILSFSVRIFHKLFSFLRNGRQFLIDRFWVWFWTDDRNFSERRGLRWSFESSSYLSHGCSKEMPLDTVANLLGCTVPWSIFGLRPIIWKLC